MQDIGPARRRGLQIAVCAVRKEPIMPDHEDLERRLWRTMPWDAEIMVPSEENDALEEAEEEGEKDAVVRI